MKQIKIFSLLLCAGLIMSLTGCAGSPEPPTTIATQPTTQETTQEATIETTAETTAPSYTDPTVTYHAPMSAVALPVVTESSKANDGTPLFTYSYQNMSLFLQDAPVADEIYLDFLNRLDACHTFAIGLHSSAASAYTGQKDWIPYSLRVQYQPMRFDEMVMSLFASESIFDGTTRGNSTNFSVTYDLLTGKALGIRDILVADYSAEDLVDLIVAGLAQYEKDELLFPNYATLISDMFYTNRPAENWYFDQGGLCFFFNPYEIAPYSSGMLISTIPYDTLSGLLKDGYFPSESVTFAGTPGVMDFSTASTNNFNAFAELILSDGGKELLLYAEGTLLNVRIETGTRSENGKEFIPEATVFAATAISSGDAVMIQCGSADLQLTYESQGQVHQLLLLEK